jgi:hypothetical protein
VTPADLARTNGHTDLAKQLEVAARMHGVDFSQAKASAQDAQEYLRASREEDDRPYEVAKLLNDCSKAEHGSPSPQLAEGKLHGKDFLRKLLNILEEKQQLRLVGPSNNGKTHLARWMARLWIASASKPGEGRYIEKTVKMTTLEEHVWVAREQVGGSTRECWGPLKYLWHLAEEDQKARFVLILNEANRGGLFNILNEQWWEALRAERDGGPKVPKNLAIIFTENPATGDYRRAWPYSSALHALFS